MSDPSATPAWRFGVCPRCKAPAMTQYHADKRQQWRWPCLECGGPVIAWFPDCHQAAILAAYLLGGGNAMVAAVAALAGAWDKTREPDEWVIG